MVLEKTSEDLLKVRLCALLHDIGKPLCWALKKSWSNHVEIGHDILKSTFGEELAKMAVSHHTTNAYNKFFHPGNKMERTISTADHIASGSDRHMDEDPTYGGAYPSLPVFMTHVLATNKHAYTIQPNDLLAFTEDFKNKFKNAPVSEDVFNNVYRFLSDSIITKIPADTRSPYNDVSLFDHLRLTSAIANCIWSQGYSNTDPSSYQFSIISADVDRISSFIGRSSRLPDLRAGSFIISNAVKKSADVIRSNVGNESVIFEGGGGFLAIADPKFTTSLIDNIHSTFEKSTMSDATISTSSIIVDGKEIQRDFTNVWEKTIRTLHDKKLQREDNIPVFQEGTNLCEICRTRASVFKEARGMLVNTLPSYEEVCSQCKTRRKIGQKGKSLHDIVDSNNLVAILKMDGDDMGEIINGDRITKMGKHTTPSRLATISRLVHQACESELGKIVDEDFGGIKIYIGGDDILAIFSGNDVFKAAIKMYDTFTNMLGGSVSMSAGISIFNYMVPVYAGLEVANECLKRAKNNEGKSSICFDFVYGIPLSTIHTSTIDTDNSTSKHVYKWQDFKKLLTVVDSLKNMQLTPQSSTSLNQVRKIVEHGGKDQKIETELAIKYNMGRGVFGWNEGNNLLDYLKEGTINDAFIIYNLLRNRNEDGVRK